MLNWDSRYLCHFSTEMAEIWSPGTSFQDVWTCKISALYLLYFQSYESFCSRISKLRWLVFFFLPKTFSTTFFSQHFQSSKHSTVIKRKNRLILCAKIQVQNVCCCQFWKERILLKSDSLSYRLVQRMMSYCCPYFSFYDVICLVKI